MSLINQVLKDLDARHATPAAAITPALRPAARRPSRWFYAVAVLTVLTGVGAGLYAAWPRAGVSPPDAAAAAPPASPAAPPAAGAPRQSAGVVSPPVSADRLTPPPPDRGTNTPATAVAGSSALPPAGESRPLVSSRGLVEVDAPPVAAAPVESRTAGTIDRPDGSPRPVIRKRARPPTPEQEASGHYREALVLLQRGRHAEAEVRLKAALEHYPAHRAAREALAGTLLAQGRRVEALPLLERGLLLDPGHAKLAQLAAQLYLENGHPEKAVARLEAAVSANPDLELLATLAAALQSARRYGESAALYRKLVEVRPEQGGYWAGLGIALDRSGEVEAARAAYRRARAAGGLKPALGSYVARRLEALGG